MPYHGKDKVATSAIPSHEKENMENIARALLAPPIRSLNSDMYMTPQLRAKEMADTRSIYGLSRKHLGKERSLALGMGEVSQKQKGKVDTGSIPQKQKGKVDTGSIPQKQKGKMDTGLIQKHNAYEKFWCPPGPVNMTESRVAGDKKQHTRSNIAKEKMCHPDQRRQHTQGIQRPVSMTEAPVAGEKKEHTRSNNAKETMRPPDQLRQHMRGIQGPVSMTEARGSGEKKQHARSNTSFPTKRTTPQLKTRTSSRCSNASASRHVNPHDRAKAAAAQEQRQSAATKLVKDMEDIIQKLNELGLGEDISFEEYYEYLAQLPKHPSIDTKIELSAVDCSDMELRQAVYRIRSYKLSQNVSKNELCCDELKECPMDLLEKEEFPSDFLVKMNYFKFLQREGVLDWSFHPKLCKIAGLNDYQRLVPRDHWLEPQNHWEHGAYEYANWEEYMSHFHTYEMEHEYIKYFETLLGELKWLKNCSPIKRTSSPIADKICTRGIYQATKIATRFSKITSHLAFFGFYECFTYMSIEATWYDGSDHLFFEIWKRVAQEKSLGDAVKEVYKLSKFFSRHDFLKYVVEEDDLIILEKGFQTCMRGIADDVSEDEARELFVEAVKKLRIKPKFYCDYIRKKIDIARSVKMITTN
ncbi:unnamed protein product [Alopecurus aequalis]